MANVDAESAAASEAPQIENEPVAEAGGSADCNRFSQHGIKLVVKKLATESRPHGADATTDSTARSSSGDVPVSAREQLSILIEQPEGDVIGERIKGLQRQREELKKRKAKIAAELKKERKQEVKRNKACKKVFDEALVAELTKRMRKQTNADGA